MTLMIRVALALSAVLATAAVADAQINTTPQPGLPNLGPFTSPSGTPSPQPLGTPSPINPATGLPSNEPAVNPQTGLPSASPSTTSAPFTLPPPVWSPPSPPAGVPLTPGSR